MVTLFLISEDTYVVRLDAGQGAAQSYQNQERRFHCIEEYAVFCTSTLSNLIANL